MKINTKLSSSSSAADEELDEQLSPRGLSSNHYHNNNSSYHQQTRGSFFASAQRNNQRRPIKTSISSLSGLNDHQDCGGVDELQDQSPPNSPALRLPPHCFSSNSSISSWKSRSSPSGSDSSSEDGDSQHELCNNLITSSQASNSGKEERMSYSTKFARYHLETYRQNDRVRWNFDFEHNRPLDEQHHHHHQAVARYQWEPAI